MFIASNKKQYVYYIIQSYFHSRTVSSNTWVILHYLYKIIIIIIYKHWQTSTKIVHCNSRVRFYSRMIRKGPWIKEKQLSRFVKTQISLPLYLLLTWSYINLNLTLYNIAYNIILLYNTNLVKYYQCYEKLAIPWNGHLVKHGKKCIKWTFFVKYLLYL